MNPDLDKLHAYPFERLAQLKQGITPVADKPHIALSIGEPKHAAPGFVCEELVRHLNTLANYPSTRGLTSLREAICAWLARRFELTTASLDPDRHVLPVNGTREALFAIAQATTDRQQQAVVAMPNPFYQIYEGAALLAGAQPVYLNTTGDTDFLPDLDQVDAAVWQRCQLLYLCSPGNPSGKVMNVDQLAAVIDLANRHDFIIASDECYTDIYPDESNPPPSLLNAAASMGQTDFKRCIVFHSLSKRSNLPGLRSGFVAGDPAVIEKFLLYRTYHGCAMPLPTQHASIAAWNDDHHVLANRDLYREKFAAVMDILSPVMAVERPDAAFYLWPETPLDDEEFARGLFARQNVTVLPGTYLSRESSGENPGRNRVRMALVATRDECVEAAERIRDYIQDIGS
jgi:N-succinyldiaminopimelate aminotransferase